MGRLISQQMTLKTNIPPTTNLITGPSRLLAIFCATHRYSPESPTWPPSITNCPLRTRLRPLFLNMEDDSPILYHVTLAGGDPIGGAHGRTTVELRDTTRHDGTLPKLGRRSKNKKRGNHNNKGKKFKDAQTLPKLTLFLLSSGRIRQYSVTVADCI